MASVFSKEPLSGATHGLPINVTLDATPGITIHDVPASTTDFDEVWLWAMNTGTSAEKLTIEWGSTTGIIEQTIPFEEGLILVVPGLVLRNDLDIDAFSPDTSDPLWIYGYVNRITV